MITYAKGASVLKQLVAWVGLDAVRGRHPAVLQGPRLRQHRVLRPARRAGEVLGPRAHVVGAGVAADRGRQHARPGLRARRRRQLHVLLGHPDRPPGLADAAPPPPRHRPVRRRRRTRGCRAARVPRGRRRGRDHRRRRARRHAQPALLLLNDEDHAYAKIRLDERSLATVIDGLSRVEDSLARALVLGCGLGHDPRRRDGAPPTGSASCWPTSARRPTRGASPGSPRWPRMAVNRYSAPAHRDALKAEWEQGLRGLLAGRRARQRPPADLRPGLRRGRPQRRGVRRPRRACSTARSPSRASRSTRTCAGR